MNAPTLWRFESVRGFGSVEFIIKNAFRPSEKLPYFFTIHYYLLLRQKSPRTDLVKSEE